MAYTIEAASPDLFEFDLGPGSDTYRVPVINSLPVGRIIEIEEIRAMPDSERSMHYTMLVKSIFDDAAPGVVDGLTVAQFEALMEAYLEASGFGDAGESSPSRER